MDTQKKSIVVIVIYLILLLSIYSSIKSRRTEKDIECRKTTIEGFNFEIDDKKEETTDYSYGTLLRNISLVNDEAKKFMSVRPQKFTDTSGYKLQMPKQFNGIEVWKDYLSPITEQGQCGNCWAHSSGNVLADRFNILSLGAVKFIPSPYDPTICGAYSFTDIEKQWKNEEQLKLMDDYFQGRKVDPSKKLQSAACEGTDLYTVANILYTEGITDISCFPQKYTGAPKTYDVNNTRVGTSSKLPYCYKLQGLEFDTCVDGKTAMRKYRAKTCYNVGDPEKDTIEELELAIMHEIYRNGPVLSGFVVFDDFMDPRQFNPKTSIYQHKNKNARSNGGHAIRIVGWGEETVNGQLIPFWWVANSWGKNWGINGYFKFKRRMRECMMEMNVVGMLPDFPGMVITDTNIIPIETSNEIKIREFTKHYLDPTSGFFTSALEKIKNCNLDGIATPYVHPQDSFPDYRNFYAAEIRNYTDKFPRKGDKNKIVTCSTSPGVVQPPSPGVVQPPSPGVVQPPSPGVVQPPSPSPCPPCPIRQSSVEQPPTEQPPTEQPPTEQSSCSKNSISDKSSTTKLLDYLSEKEYILEFLLVTLSIFGSAGIWYFFNMSRNKTTDDKKPE